IKLRTTSAIVAGAIVAKDEASASKLIEEELAQQAEYQSKLLHPQLSVQNAEILLRQCALAKSGYIARASSPNLTQSLLRAAAEMTWETWQEKMAFQADEMRDTNYQEWLMPIRLGG